MCPLGGGVVAAQPGVLRAARHLHHQAVLRLRGDARQLPGVVARALQPRRVPGQLRRKCIT